MKNWFIKLKIASCKSGINSLIKFSDSYEDDESEYVSDFMLGERFQEETDEEDFHNRRNEEDFRNRRTESREEFEIARPSRDKIAVFPVEDLVAIRGLIGKNMIEDIMTYAKLIQDPLKKDIANELFTKIQMDVENRSPKIKASINDFIADVISSSLAVNKDVDTSDLDKEIENEKGKPSANVDEYKLLSLLNRLIKIKLNSEIRNGLIDTVGEGSLMGVEQYERGHRLVSFADDFFRSDVIDEQNGVKFVAENVGEMIFITTRMFKSMSDRDLHNKGDTVASFFNKHKKYFPEKEYYRDISKGQLRIHSIIKDYDKYLEINGVKRRLIIHLIFILMDLVNVGNSDIIEFCATRIGIMARESQRRRFFMENSADSKDDDTDIKEIEEKGMSDKATSLTHEIEKKTKRQQDKAKLISDNLLNFYNGLLDVSNKIKGVKSFLISKMSGISGSDGYVSIIDTMLDEYDSSISDIAIRIQNSINNNSTPDEVGMSVAYMSDDKVSFKFNKNEVVLDSLNDFGSFDFSPDIDYHSMYESAISSNLYVSKNKYAAFLGVMNRFLSSNNSKRKLNDFIQQMSNDKIITNYFISGINRSTAKSTLLIDKLVEQLKDTTGPLSDAAIHGGDPSDDRKRILESFISNPDGGVLSLKDAVRAAIGGQRSIQKKNTSRILAIETIKFGLDAMQELYNSSISITDDNGNVSEKTRGDDPAVKSILSSMLVGLGISKRICKIMGMISDKKHKYNTGVSSVDTGVVKTYDELIKRIEERRGDLGGSLDHMSNSDAKKAINLYLRVFNLVKPDGSIDLVELKVHCLKQKYSGGSVTPEMRSAIVNHARQEGSLDRALWGPTSIGREFAKKIVSHKPDKKSNMEVYTVRLGNVMKNLELIKVL